MRRTGEILAVGAMTAALLAGCGGDGDADRPGEVTIANEYKARSEEICAVEPYELGQYEGAVSPNLLTVIGEKAEDGTYTFNKSAEETAEVVASAVAPNTAALSAISVRMEAEEGVSQEQIVGSMVSLFDRLQSDNDMRRETCERVVGRILGTPELGKLAPASRKVIEVVPVIVNGQYAGLETIDGPAEELNVFRIAPIDGASAVDREIADSWGIDADGEFYTTSAQEGNVRIANEGAPVAPDMETDTTIPGAPSEVDGEVEMPAGVTDDLQDEDREGQAPAGGNDQAQNNGPAGTTPTSGPTGSGSGAGAGGGGCGTGAGGCEGQAPNGPGAGPGTGETDSGTGTGTGGGSGGGGETPRPTPPTTERPTPPTTERPTPVTTPPTTPPTVERPTTPTTVEVGKGAAPETDDPNNPYD